MSLVNKVLTKLQFSKTWLSKENFPTYEMREDQVRADMQYLHDETQTAFNNLVDDLESLSAENIPFTSSAAIPASDVQSAIANVQQQVADAYAGTAIPNGSITDEKLATGVPTNKADLVGGIVKASQLRFRKVSSSRTDGVTEYTLQADDVNHFIELTQPWGRTIVIPDTEDIPVGGVVLVVAYDGYTPIERPLVFSAGSNTVRIYYPGVYTGVSQYSTTEFASLFVLIRLGDVNTISQGIIHNWFIGKLA